jgi:hypothetical protein
MLGPHAASSRLDKRALLVMSISRPTPCPSQMLRISPYNSILLMGCLTGRGRIDKRRTGRPIADALVSRQGAVGFLPASIFAPTSQMCTSRPRTRNS